MRVHITSNQAVLLFFVFLTSSAIINIPSPLISFAGNAAWISLLLSACLGLMSLVPMVWLSLRYPGKSFIEYSREVVGVPVSMMLGAAFLSYQMEIGAGIVLDIAMFMRSSMMRSTPSFWFILLTFAVVAITVRSGIDKITGLFPVLMGNVVFFTFLIIFMSWNNFEPGHLLPIMPDGIKPLLHGVYFSFGFPYVEVAIFSMILPFIGNSDRKLGRKLAAALLLNMTTLVATTVATILVFGPIAGDRKYAIFEVARTVEITDVFQRIEALIGYSLIVASFMKTTIILFTSHQTLIQLPGLKEDKMLVYPLAAMMALLSLTYIGEGDAKWVFFVSGIHPLWGLTCGAGTLLLVAFIALCRKKGQAPH